MRTLCNFHSKIEIPFSTDLAGVPILKAIHDETTISILVDTGAEMSLVDKSYGGIIEEVDNNEAYKLGSFLESSATVSKSAMCALTVEDVHKENVDLIVVADEASFSNIKTKYDNLVMIIGSDQLSDWHAQIDYDKKVLTIYNDLSCK